MKICITLDNECPPKEVLNLVAYLKNQNYLVWWVEELEMDKKVKP